MTEPVRFALVGNPVHHSMSPLMHARAFSVAGIEGRFNAIEADEAVLGEAVESLRAGDLQGLNVTMPLKASAATLADRLTAEASAASSANTLRAADGVVEGHSTDVTAVGRLAGTRFSDIGVALVLGSGGAATAAAAALERLDVYFSARDARKAVAVNSRFGGAGVVSWGVGVAGALVVNATSLGMRGESVPLPPIRLCHGLIDLPYGAAPTPAVVVARARGVPVVDGAEFLSVAAAESFQWWTGVAVDSALLLEAARNP